MIISKTFFSILAIAAIAFGGIVHAAASLVVDANASGTASALLSASSSVGGLIEEGKAAIEAGNMTLKAKIGVDLLRVGELFVSAFVWLFESLVKAIRWGLSYL